MVSRMSVPGIAFLFVLSGCTSSSSIVGSAAIGKISDGGNTKGGGQFVQDGIPANGHGAGKANGRDGKPPAPEKFLNVTPFTAFTDEWDLASSTNDNQNTANDEAGSGGIFPGTYTRLIIRGTTDRGGGATGDKDILRYESRTLLARYFFGKDYSVNLTAKVTVGAFVETVPLITLEHQSNSDVGEQWSRAIYHSSSHFPLFLVKSADDRQSTIPEVQFKFRRATEYSSRAAATTMQAVLGVAQVISPASAVVTTLSTQSMKDRSDALDSQISKLFSFGLSEEHWASEDIRYWKAKRGARLTLSIPKNEDPKADGLNREPIGTWVVSFDDPRPSIFSEWRICIPMSKAGARKFVKEPVQEQIDDMLLKCAPSLLAAQIEAYRALDSDEILSYSLVSLGSNLGSIRSYLTQFDWFISAQGDLGAETSARIAAPNFCRKIRGAITNLGLNGADASIVVWSVMQSMPLPAGAADILINDRVCGQFVLPIVLARRAPTVQGAAQSIKEAFPNL